MERNKHLFRIILLIFFTRVGFSQTTFQKTYGELGSWGLNIQQTSDNGFIILGRIDSIGAGSSDIYLIKLDYKGDTSWTKVYGGAALDRGNYILQTTDGGYILACYTYSFGAGDADFLLIKTDSLGNILWNKTYGGTGIDYAFNVGRTYDGNYIVFGLTTSFGIGNNGTSLLKIDSVGNIIWCKAYGGTGYSYSWGLNGQQTLDSGFVVIRSATNNAINDADTHIFKTDSSGNVIWCRNFGGQDDDGTLTGQQTLDGGYIFAGVTLSFGASSYDIYLVKCSATGNLLWSKTFGGTSSETAISVKQTIDGGFILFGQTNSFGISPADLNLILIKTDSTGSLQWSKIYGDTANESAALFGFTNDGYILGGVSYSFGNGGTQFYLIRTDSIGVSGCFETNITPIVTAPSTQTVIPPMTVTSYLPSVSTPTLLINHGGIANTLCINVGMEETSNNSSFQLNPNPSTGNFTIDFERIIMKGKVEILNILGENIFVKNISNEPEKVIYLKNISSGIYFVKVFDGEKSYCKKLIVEHD